MKQLQIVSPAYVYDIWDSVEKYISFSIAAGLQDVSLDQYKMYILNGSHTLFVVVEDNNIIGAAIMNMVTSPNSKSLCISAWGGKSITVKEVTDQIEVYAKSQGVTKIVAYAQDAQARLFNQVMGLEKVTNFIEKQL
jgi:hypothetical protein